MRIRWPIRISNKALCDRAKQQSVEIQIRERKWGWLRYTLQKPDNDLTREALDWNPQGVRRQRPRMTWRRTIYEEINRMGKSWKTVKELSGNRVRWRNFTDGLCYIQELQNSSSSKLDVTSVLKTNAGDDLRYKPYRARLYCGGNTNPGCQVAR
jgi:hypothetical protein